MRKYRFKLKNTRGIPNVITGFKAAPYINGTEATIYFSCDGNFVMKVYHLFSAERQDIIQRQLAIKCDDPQLLFPIAIIEQMEQTPCSGILMKRASQKAVPLAQVVHSPVAFLRQVDNGWNWQDYIQIAKEIAQALERLEQYGWIHNDLHFHNILVHPETKKVWIIDLDSAQEIHNKRIEPRGKWGFIAPEVVKKEVPTIESQYFSLAAIIAWTLLFRNVMLPKICHDEHNQLLDYQLGYGEYAAFSEDDQNPQNYHLKIGQPLFKGGALSYRSLMPDLRRLIEKAFVKGLHNKKQRPTALEWKEALENAMLQLKSCIHCKQPNGIDSVYKTCVFCGEKLED